MKGVRARVLVVERDDETAQALLRSLRGAGYEPILAKNRATALAAFDAVSPALVFVAIDLGEDDGVLVCGEIRDRPDGAIVPIVLLGGAGVLMTASDAVAWGADELVRKPVDHERLLARVRVWTGRRESDEAVRAQIEKVEAATQSAAEEALEEWFERYDDLYREAREQEESAERKPSPPSRSVREPEPTRGPEPSPAPEPDGTPAQERRETRPPQPAGVPPEDARGNEPEPDPTSDWEAAPATEPQPAAALDPELPLAPEPERAPAPDPEVAPAPGARSTAPPEPEAVRTREPEPPPAPARESRPPRKPDSASAPAPEPRPMGGPEPAAAPEPGPPPPRVHPPRRPPMQEIGAAVWRAARIDAETPPPVGADPPPPRPPAPTPRPAPIRPTKIVRRAPATRGPPPKPRAAPPKDVHPAVARREPRAPAPGRVSSGRDVEPTSPRNRRDKPQDNLQRAKKWSRPPASDHTKPQEENPSPAAAISGRTSHVLETLSLAERLRGERRTGVLQLESGLALGFLDGVPCSVAGPHAASALAERLLAAGEIAPRDADALRARKTRGRADVLLIRLVRAKTVEPAPAWRCLESLVLDAIGSLLAHAGSWRFDDRSRDQIDRPGGMLAPVDVGSRAVELLARSVPLSRLLSAIGGDTARLRLTAWPHGSVRPQHQPLLARFDGRTSLAEARAAAGIPVEDAAAVAVVLLATGQATHEGFATLRPDWSGDDRLSWSASARPHHPAPTAPPATAFPPLPFAPAPPRYTPAASHVAPSPTPLSVLPAQVPLPTYFPPAYVATAPPPLVPSPPVPQPTQMPLPIAEPPQPTLHLDDLARRIRRADYFEILGVDRDADTGAIERAHAAARARVLALSSAGRPENEAKTREILSTLDEAAMVLLDPRLRDAYRRNLAR